MKYIKLDCGCIVEEHPDCQLDHYELERMAPTDWPSDYFNKPTTKISLLSAGGWEFEICPGKHHYFNKHGERLED